MILKESIWFIGRKSSVQFWIDNWLGTPLIERINNLIKSINALVIRGLFVGGWLASTILFCGLLS